MTAQDMTIREIGELCGVAESTVRTWIASAETAGLPAKTADAKASKQAARYSLPEVLAIIRAGGKSLLADLLEHNAAGAPEPAPRLPNGKQLEALERMTRARAITASQLQVLLGVARPRPPYLPELPASEAAGLAALAEIRARLGIPQGEARPGLPPRTVERVVGAAAGATRRTLEAISRELEAGAGGLG